MKDLFILEKFSRKSFSKHFLSSVHTQINSKEITIDDVFARDSAITKNLKASGFTIRETITTGSFKLEKKDNDKVPTFTSKTDEHSGLKYINLEKKITIQITDKTLSVSTDSYNGFEDFQDNIIKIVENIYSDNISIDSIGLRKIDNIQINNLNSFDDILSIFNLALFGTLRARLIPEEHFQIYEDLIILNNNYNKAALRTMLKKDNPNTYSAKLDFDLIKDATESEPLTIKDSVKKILSHLNETHYNLFRWSITEVMLNLMEEGV